MALLGVNCKSETQSLDQRIRLLVWPGSEIKMAQLRNLEAFSFVSFLSLDAYSALHKQMGPSCFLVCHVYQLAQCWQTFYQMDWVLDRVRRHLSYSGICH